MDSIFTEKVLRLDRYISSSSSIAIVSHTNPDGDALGSCVALRNYLVDNRQKQARIILPSQYSDATSFILGEADLKNLFIFEDHQISPRDLFKDIDLIICLDISGPSRTGNMENTLREARVPKILIDHHLSPEESAFDLVFSKIDISSASEYLYEILKALPHTEGENEQLPMSSLTAIMTGITTDTNNFANSVFPSTLSNTAELLAAGVDRDEILLHTYNEFRENRVRLMGYLLSKLMKITEQGVAYMVLDKRTARRFDIKDGELEGLVNIPLSIKEVKMSIFAREDFNKFRISIRSKKGISANKCAALYFNGGGHEQAAGGRLSFPRKKTKRDTVEKYIQEVTTEFFQNRRSQ